jgi:hypothetical protein
VRRFLLVAVGIAAVLFAITYIVRFMAIDRCLDHGGRWNDDGCECTPEQLSDPAVKPEFVAYCDKPLPAPTN